MNIFIYKNNNQSGPYLPDQVKEMLQRGEISTEDQVWYEGLPEWRPLPAINELIPNPTPPATKVPHNSPKSEVNHTPLLTKPLVVGVLVFICLCGLVLWYLESKQAREDAEKAQEEMKSHESSVESAKRSMEFRRKAEEDAKAIQEERAKRTEEDRARAARLSSTSPGNWDSFEEQRLRQGKLPIFVKVSGEHMGYSEEAFAQLLREFKMTVGASGYRIVCSDKQFYDIVADCAASTVAIGSVMNEGSRRRMGWPQQVFVSQLTEKLKPWLQR